MLHYYSILQWWNKETRDGWLWEQEIIPVPLKEWVLCIRDHSKWIPNKWIVNTLVKFWKSVHDISVPSMSPLATFSWHPHFRIPAMMSHFSEWIENGLGTFCELRGNGQMFAQEHFAKIIGEGGKFLFQFRQVHNFIRELLKKSDVLHPLTGFQCLLSTYIRLTWNFCSNCNTLLLELRFTPHRHSKG